MRFEALIEVQRETFAPRTVRVSGRVSETPDEYLVDLDRGLDLEDPLEIDRAEDALVRACRSARSEVAA